MNAMQTFHLHIKGENFMTPTVVEYGFLGDTGIAYEISKGEGFVGDTIYGFTVGLPINDPRRREWSGCFPSMHAVNKHIQSLI